MTTVAKVNDALAELGVEERLVYNRTAGGYYYFCKGESHRWKSTVLVGLGVSIQRATVEDILFEYAALKATMVDNS